MPPRKKATAPPPETKRTTRSATANDPSQEFAVLPPPTRKKSASAASTTSTNVRKPKAGPKKKAPATKAVATKVTATKVAANKVAANKVVKNTSGRSLRRHFTIELPAQRAIEAALAQAKEEEEAKARELEEIKAQEIALLKPHSIGKITKQDTTTPTPPKDTMISPPQENDTATAPGTPSPSHASPWGLSTLFNSVKRVVLSPFPPSRRLQNAIASVTRSPSATTPDIRPPGLSPIIEESPSRIEETPAAARAARKRKNSDPQPEPPKKLRLTADQTPEPVITRKRRNTDAEQTPEPMVSRKRRNTDAEQESPKKRRTSDDTPEPVRARSPVKNPQTPTRQSVRTPARRSARALRELRRTPARVDPIFTAAALTDPIFTAAALAAPAVTAPAVTTPAVTTPVRYNTFTVPDESPSPEAADFPHGSVLGSGKADKDHQDQHSPELQHSMADSPSKTPSRTRREVETKEGSTSPSKAVVAAEPTKKRKRVKIDDLECIPCRRPGQSTGTFALLDEFFDYDQDSIEIDESQLELCYERPAKKARLEQNVFEMAAPAPPVPSPKKTPKAVSKPQESPEKTLPDTPIFDANQAPDALQRKRSEAEKYKPTKGSRLREMQRLSSLSSAGSSFGSSSLLGNTVIDDSLASPPLQDASPMRQSTFEGFTEVMGSPAEAPAAPSPGKDRTSTPSSSPPGSPPTPQASTELSKERSSDAAAVELEPEVTIRDDDAASEPEWNFPGGTSMEEYFTEEEIEYTKAHPPTEEEIEEALVQLKKDYADFVADGGLDLPIEHYLNM